MELEAREIENLLVNKYMLFIKNFVEVAPGKELGQNAIELERYLAKVNLKDFVKTSLDGMLFFKPNILEKANWITIMGETIRYLKDKPWGVDLEDLLPLLNTLYLNQGKKEFKKIIIHHEDFLKQTDILYGLAEGKFLTEIENDDSLKKLPDWLACLRLCRKLLLTILHDCYENIGSIFESKILSFSLLNRLEVSKYGVVKTRRIEDALKELPENKRVIVLLENFMPFITWIVEELYRKLEDNVSNVINRLRVVLRLNREVALRTGVYNSLVEFISGRIPSRYVGMLRLAEGFE